MEHIKKENLMTTEQNGFYGLGIAPSLLDKIHALGFKIPTSIQRKAIPIIIEGKDIIGIAQTGTGKTLAFGIPMIQRLAQQKGKALILVPTRELAVQVKDALKPFFYSLHMNVSVLIGGESQFPQITSLRRNPRVIIATPGRLIDHLEQRNVRLDDVHVLILDEADRMLDMGFAPQIERILKTVPKDRQTMLFSATMPTEIVKIASQHMHLPVRTEIVPPGTTAENLTQEIFVIRKDLKEKLLLKILKQYNGSVLLFTRTRRGAKQVAQTLRRSGNSSAEIHADRSLSQRREALDGFKSGRYRILVATDIAARGIDVKGIELVINYDLPEDPDNYVHRIGRTGRAGQKGHAISFATPEQGGDVKSIEQLIKMSIALSTHPEMPAEKFVFSAPARMSFQRRDSRRPSWGQRRSSSRPHSSRRR